MVARSAFILDEMKDKAKAEGRAEERAEGEKKKTLDIAKNLLDVLDDEIIAEKTGLSIDEVRKLRKV